MRGGVLKDIDRKNQKSDTDKNKSNNLEMIKAQIELENKLRKQE